MKTTADPLPEVAASTIEDGNTIICPNCKQPHGVFYVRHDDKRRTLHYRCNRVKLRWVAAGEDEWKHGTRIGRVEFVDDLAVREEWTARCRKLYQNAPWRVKGAILNPA